MSDMLLIEPAPQRGVMRVLGKIASNFWLRRILKMLLITWIVIAALFRYSSLASLIAAAFAPFFTLMFFDRPSVALAVSVMSLLLIWRHRHNIVKLVKGRESRIGDKAREPEPDKPRRRRRRVKRLHDEAAPGPDPRSPRS